MTSLIAQEAHNVNAFEASYNSVLAHMNYGENSVAHRRHPWWTSEMIEIACLSPSKKTCFTVTVRNVERKNLLVRSEQNSVG